MTNQPMTDKEIVEGFALAMKYFEKGRGTGRRDKMQGWPQATIGLGSKEEGYVTPWDAGYIAGYSERG